ncbi:MAG TPA: class I SAM-dependent methyltransferase [Ktedonobacteraceae bacterium]|jgi:ubiquinone/menaquinone biosynthesis C-methylase UbiE
MNHSANPQGPDGHPVSHPRFSTYYERASQNKEERRLFEPLRQEVLSQAQGVVLEVGVGTGLNFAFYQPAQVERVEAIEPDATMLAYARTRLAQAQVPLTLTQASAEALPFADGSFDCAVATLVFCSVADPLRGLREVRRVLKPGGTLLLLEHVRARGHLAARLQDLLVPLTTRFAGNCHWNRNTGEAVLAAGFEIRQQRSFTLWLLPMLLLQAVRS